MERPPGCRRPRHEAYRGRGGRQGRGAGTGVEAGLQPTPTRAAPERRTRRRSAGDCPGPAGPDGSHTHRDDLTALRRGRLRGRVLQYPPVQRHRAVRVRRHPERDAATVQAGRRHPHGGGDPASPPLPGTFRPRRGVRPPGGQRRAGAGGAARGRLPSDPSLAPWSGPGGVATRWRSCLPEGPPPRQPRSHHRHRTLPAVAGPRRRPRGRHRPPQQRSGLGLRGGRPTGPTTPGHRRPPRARHPGGHRPAGLPRGRRHPQPSPDRGPRRSHRLLDNRSRFVDPSVPHL